MPQPPAAPAVPAVPPVPVVLSSFEALAAPLHGDVICSYLEGDARLRMSVVSHALREFYGESLTELRVPRWGRTHRTHALVSLVQRQLGLQKVDVDTPDTLPALVHLLREGHLRQVRDLCVKMDYDASTTLGRVQRLASAMRVPGALQSLEYLRFLPRHWEPGTLPLLAGALASSDVSPSLRVLDLGWREYLRSDADALVTMVGTRGAGESLISALNGGVAFQGLQSLALVDLHLPVD